MTRGFLFFLGYLLICLQGICDDWQRVYLASFPRSGNHWIRYLIEEATQIATSSVYRDPDPPHLDQIFPWGGYCVDHGYEGNCRYPGQDDIVVIKTHFPNSLVLNPFHYPYVRTIRIVRHPVDCFYSLYVYRHQGKKDHQFYLPKRNLVSFIDQWLDFEKFWNNKSNVTTFRYEDLYNNPHAVLSKILEAIGYLATEEDIARAIKKYPPNGEPLKHLSHYTQDDLRFMAEALQEHLEKYSYEIPNL